MDQNIPTIIDALYRYFVTEPDPRFWPDYFRHDPVQRHGLWSFYQRLRLGIQLSAACPEKP